MKLILILLSLFAMMLAYAQEKPPELPYLIVAPFFVPDHFSEFEVLQSEKIILKESTRQTKYQVILGDPEESKKFKFAIHKIEVNVTATGDDDITISTRLVDVRKDKTVNSISEGPFTRLQYFRKLEDIIRRLFLLPDSPPKEEIPKIKQERQKKIILKVPNESKDSALDFKKRIMALKNGVNDAIAVAAAEKDVEKSDDKQQDRKKTNSAITESGNNATAEQENILPVLPPAATLPLDIGHSMRGGFYSVKTNSLDNLIDTDSAPKYLLIDYEYARQWNLRSSFYHHINVRYGKTVNKEEKEFAPYTGGGIYEGYHVQKLNWLPKGGIEMDTISFKNLPVIGKGLAVANNRIFWATLSSAHNFNLFKWPFRFSASLGLPIKMMSDYSGLDQDPKLSGNKINLTLALLNVYKKFHLEFNFFKSNIEAQSSRMIKMDTSGVGYNVFYNF